MPRVRSTRRSSRRKRRILFNLPKRILRGLVCQLPAWRRNLLGKRRGFILKKFHCFEIPEVSLCFSAFFLHFFWEVVHTYFYTLKDADFSTMLYCWLYCTWVDVMITLGTFWLVSLISWNRRWFLSLNRVNFAVFIMAGVGYTFLSERLNVHIFQSWSYNESMPIIPWVKVGLTPILQWFIIPSVVILLVRTIFHYHHSKEKNVNVD